MVTTTINGNQLNRAPKYTFNVGGTYHHEIFKGDLSLTANAFFSAKYFGELGDRVVLPAYKIVNASVTWRAPGNHYYVTVFGENLTNQVYPIGVFISAIGDKAVDAKPRWGGVTVGVDF